MDWQLIIDRSAEKQFRKIPKNDAERLRTVIQELAINPYGGDVEKMEGEKNVWRRRVGSYRIFFEIHTDKKLIYIFEIRRRTSTTY